MSAAMSAFEGMGSIDPDACDPQNTCPLPDFGFQEASKFVRSYSGGLKTEACQALLHLWRRDGRGDFAVEQSDDISRGLGWGEHPDRSVAFHVRIPRLAKGWHSRQCLNSVFATDGKC